MKAKKLLEIVSLAEKLKNTTRHCYTSSGRHESVAEHSWMMTLIAFFMKDEFQEADIDKVIKMCIIHDLGECFIGDIPAFEKSKNQDKLEEDLLFDWLESLPSEYRLELKELYTEMIERETIESKIYKAIDGIEAVIQHNLSDLSTWTPEEYDFNLTYANDKVEFSKYMIELRTLIRNQSIEKINKAKK